MEINIFDTSTSHGEQNGAALNVHTSIYVQRAKRLMSYDSEWHWIYIQRFHAFLGHFLHFVCTICCCTSSLASVYLNNESYSNFKFQSGGLHEFITAPKLSKKKMEKYRAWNLCIWFLEFKKKRIIYEKKSQIWISDDLVQRLRDKFGIMTRSTMMCVKTY